MHTNFFVCKLSRRDPFGIICHLLSGIFYLDKEHNCCDNGSTFPMEFNKRIYRIFLSLVAAWCGLIVAAPLLASNTPLTGVASQVYSLFSPICHQFDSRSFHLAGEKLGVCIRCSSIYFSFFTSLALYPLFRRLNSFAVPRIKWLILALAPMVLDVMLNIASIHLSTILTRMISGIMFGGILPFFLFPPLIEALSQIRNRLTLRGGIFYARKAQ